MGLLSREQGMLAAYQNMDIGYSVKKKNYSNLLFQHGENDMQEFELGHMSAFLRRATLPEWGPLLQLEFHHADIEK